jgi:hypothetical protein
MASSFGRYQGGIEASTGNLVPAAGQMAQQTYGAIAGLGQNLAEGLKQYNENSQKSEAANAKIQMLGQAYADKIAMYSKDPEIAQSGILDSLMAKAKMLQDAPTKGLSQRVMIAHEAETSLSGFGNQLQEWSFLRGREMERESQMALDRFKGFKSVTQPAFAGDAEFQLDLNLTPQEAQAQALAKLNRIRKSNPNLQGTDEEFLATWRTAREQALANAKDIPPSVVSAGLEALQADKNNAKAQAEAQKQRDLSGVLSSKFWSTEAPAVGGALNLPSLAKPSGEQPLFLAPVGKTVSSMKDYEKTVVSPVEQVNRKNSAISSEKLNELKGISANAQTNLQTLEQKLAGLKAKQKEEAELKFFKATPSGAEKTLTWLEGVQNEELRGLIEKYGSINKKTGDYEIDKFELAKDVIAKMNPVLMGQAIMLSDYFNKGGKSQYEKNAIKTQASQFMLDSGKLTLDQQASEVQKQIDAQKAILGGINTAVAPKGIASVPKVPLGSIQIGTQEKIQRLSVADRQKQVADFVTSRMGAIDPTDPERKRRLPVSGFDKFYKSLVPESEIREFTTDSGTRMLYANGKWEQLKSADPVTMQDIRKGSIGIYGEQDAFGKLVPTEFTEGSGVYIGGMFKGTDAANDKYSEEIGNLIDARRGLKKLTEINDRTGEFFSPSAQGEAEVEVMNLSAMLRTDIIGVGTVSNYEQELIKKVIRNPTDFFNLESKDRAILLALAQRVDRRIKSVSASKGLTVIMKDDTGGNKYQALREQYLREKGIL